MLQESNTENIQPQSKRAEAFTGSLTTIVGGDLSTARQAFKTDSSTNTDESSLPDLSIVGNDQSASSQKVESTGWSTVVARVAEGAINEVTNNPGRVLENALIGAGIAAAATLLSTPVLLGLGAAGIAYTAYSLYNHTGDFLQAARTVANPAGATKQEVQAANAMLRSAGEQLTDFAAGFGGGSALGLRSALNITRSASPTHSRNIACTSARQELAHPVSPVPSGISVLATRTSAPAELVEIQAEGMHGLKVFNTLDKSRGASEEFVSSSLDGLRRLGVGYLTEMRNNNVKVVFGRTVRDIHPDSQYAAVYLPDEKTILLAQHRPGIGYPPAEVAAHEAGHAIDHARNWPSQSPRFQSAHKADVQADVHQKLYHYLVNGTKHKDPNVPWQSTERGRHEALATLFQAWNASNIKAGATQINSWANASKFMIESGLVDPRNVPNELRKLLKPELRNALSRAS